MTMSEYNYDEIKNEINRLKTEREGRIRTGRYYRDIDSESGIPG